MPLRLAMPRRKIELADLAAERQAIAAAMHALVLAAGIAGIELPQSAQHQIARRAKLVIATRGLALHLRGKVVANAVAQAGACGGLLAVAEVFYAVLLADIACRNRPVAQALGQQLCAAIQRQIGYCSAPQHIGSHNPRHACATNARRQRKRVWASRHLVAVLLHAVEVQVKGRGQGSTARILQQRRSQALGLEREIALQTKAANACAATTI